MRRYCLDTNVFIQAKNGPYGFDIVPAFWDWIDQQVASGIIYSSTTVYSELEDGDDELASWVRERRESGLFAEPDTIVQQRFREIAEYVESTYPRHESQEFLAKADPWIVAHGKAEGSVAVTHEILVPANSSRVKIPNVCVHFGVEYINPYVMLRELNARFSLS